MDTTNLLLSFVFGTAGFCYLMFGRKMSLDVPFVCGLILMVFPYFITNAIFMSLIGLVVMAVPFLVRDV